MNYQFTKSNRNSSGTIHLPASKSINNRLLILQALCNNAFIINNMSDSDDTQLLYKALNSSDSVIDIDAAGTAMRFLTAYYAGRVGEERVLTGCERMKNRPIRILVESLRKLGTTIEYSEKDGFPPLKITGNQIGGGELAIDGRVSSQYISALLMVAPFFTNGLRLRLVNKVVSVPYIQQTIDLMKLLGFEINWIENEIVVKPFENQWIENSIKSISVESDWSAASYWYEMAAFAENVDLRIYGLQQPSIQGDSIVSQLFEPLGVKTDFFEGGIRLSKSEKPLPTDLVEIDFTNFPDLAQTLTVTLAMLDIPFCFSGLDSLRIKETDRILALQTELAKFGKTITEPETNVLQFVPRVSSPKTFFPKKIETYNDHRMAMAFAPIALLSTNIEIENPQVVSKSYPSFWHDLQSIGFEISKESENLENFKEKINP